MVASKVRSNSSTESGEKSEPEKNSQETGESSDHGRRKIARELESWPTSSVNVDRSIQY